MNPFSSCFVRADQNLYRFAADTSSDQVQRDHFFTTVERVLDDYRKLAIVGRHGTGKSTLLETLRTRLQERFTQIAWLKLTNEPHRTRDEIQELIQRLRAQGDSSPQCIVIDGYEQLKWLDRLRVNRELRRKTAYLLISSHIEQRGFVTIHRTGWDTDIATQLTIEKLRGMPAEIQTKLLTVFLRKLNDRGNHELNLRELWFLMYDDAERLRRTQIAPSSYHASTYDACSS